MPVYPTRFLHTSSYSFEAFRNLLLTSGSTCSENLGNTFSPSAHNFMHPLDPPTMPSAQGHMESAAGGSSAKQGPHVAVDGWWLMADSWSWSGGTDCFSGHHESWSLFWFTAKSQPPAVPLVSAWNHWHPCSSRSDDFRKGLALSRWIEQGVPVPRGETLMCLVRFEDSPHGAATVRLAKTLAHTRELINRLQYGTAICASFWTVCCTHIWLRAYYVP